MRFAMRQVVRARMFENVLLATGTTPAAPMASQNRWSGGNPINKPLNGAEQPKDVYTERPHVASNTPSTRKTQPDIYMLPDLDTEILLCGFEVVPWNLCIAHTHSGLAECGRLLRLISRSDSGTHLARYRSLSLFLPSSSCLS